MADAVEIRTRGAQRDLRPVPSAQTQPANRPAAIGPLAKEERRAAIEARRAREARSEAAGAVAAALAAPVAPPPVAPHAPGRSRKGLSSGLILFVLPLAVAAAYLWTCAADRYASHLAFTVRREEATGAVEILGGLSSLGGGSSDTDVLSTFLRSQDLVERVDRRIDLRAAFSVAHGRDPLFSLAPGASIEDLVAYWARAIRVIYDPGSDLIEVEVRAFDAGTARGIAAAIEEECAALVAEMSRAAREDATLHAREDLTRAEARLHSARGAMAEFRAKNRLIDPSADIAGQTGLIGTLEQELAAALIDLDMLRQTTRTAEDPRIAQAERRIAVIEDRIEAERARFAPDGTADGGRDFTSLVTEYERLAVDREFAERSYTAALAAQESALAEAARKSRYLIAFVRPTLAQSPEYPERWLILGIVAAFSGLGWLCVTLSLAALRDRQ